MYSANKNDGQDVDGALLRESMIYCFLHNTIF